MKITPTKIIIIFVVLLFIFIQTTQLILGRKLTDNEGTLLAVTICFGYAFYCMWKASKDLDKFGEKNTKNSQPPQD